MAQDTTRQQPSQGAQDRDRYGPGEHYGSGQSGAMQGGQGASPGSAQGSLSQRHPLRGGEGRGMTPSRGGAMSPYGGYGNPFDLMQRMGEEMDRIFESFGFGPTPFGHSQGRSMSPFAGFGGLGSLGGMGGAGVPQLWSPRIEVCEREGRLVVEADLPGVRKEDLSVQIEQDAIVIQGQRRQEQTSNESGYYHSERSYGSFHRMIPLPEGADADNARARFRDGVLEVEVPIQQRSRGRSLEIQDESGGRASSGRTFEGATGGGTQAASAQGGTTGTGRASEANASPGARTGVSGGGSSGGSAGSV